MKNLLLILALFASTSAFSQFYFQNDDSNLFLYSCDVYNELGVKTIQYTSDREHLRIYQEDFDKNEAKRIFFYDLSGNQTDVYLIRYNSVGEMVSTHEGVGFVQVFEY